MNFTKTMFALAIGSVGIMASSNASAFVLNNGDQLTISTNTAPLGSAASSYFAFDTNGDGVFSTVESIRIKPSLNAGNIGIIIGQNTLGGATEPSHVGAPVGTESGDIDRAWNLFGNTGTHFLTTGITGSTTAGLNMSGWNITWSGIPAINMGTGANATFVWDGVYGHTYELTYFAAIPWGDPSGLGGLEYKLHLSGTVNSVPEASTYAMMLTGLGLVGAMARRRNIAKI